MRRIVVIIRKHANDKLFPIAMPTIVGLSWEFVFELANVTK
jgi:hypothetical protein